jgi:dihydropyrimidine dehydrogenase (NAD+) subunit PreA
MADLTTDFCGVTVKNPIGVTSCDFGGSERLLRRCVDQGIGWIIGKTVHRIDGPHRWPRPYFYSLKRFGRDLADAFVCSQMFHNMPYEKWRDEELPRSLKTCEERDVLFIGSCSGIGADTDTWIPFLKDMAAAGVKMVELDTGGPHATFGAVDAHKEVGAPLAMDPETAYRVTRACVAAVDIPIMFKMTPQCINMAGVALAVERAGAAAISANNAFYGCWIDHETGTFFGVPAAMGGLMGRPWQLVSMAKVLEITATVRIPVLGGGGTATYDDCVRYLMAGCSLNGLCSSIYTRGVQVLRQCIDDLRAYMDRKGYQKIDDFQGCAVKDFRYLREWPRENPMATTTPVIPEFDPDRCNQCGICVRLCPYGALSLDKQSDPVPHLDREYCCGCGWCVGQCGSQAIRCVLAETGEVVWDGFGTIADWVRDA